MMNTGWRQVYITVNSDEDGPFEIFCNMGKAGGCAASQTEALARWHRLAFRCGISAEHVIKQLRGISCHMPHGSREAQDPIPARMRFAKAWSAASTRKARNCRSTSTGRALATAGACPDCGGTLHHEEGCIKCHDCGYSQCD